MGISVDTVADNAAMVEKLVLPFHLLSDPQGTLSQRFGVWDGEKHIAVPTIADVDQSGMIVYVYSGRDFADRPGDAAIFVVLDTATTARPQAASEPEILVTAEKARQSVGLDTPVISLEAFIPYYRGAFYPPVALKCRLAVMGEGGRESMHEITNYQRMVS
ncbi:MAG: hypothetical protein NVS2B16_26140 [Chloroflexota bacterium]